MYKFSGLKNCKIVKNIFSKCSLFVLCTSGSSIFEYTHSCNITFLNFNIYIDNVHCKTKLSLNLSEHILTGVQRIHNI